MKRANKTKQAKNKPTKPKTVSLPRATNSLKRGTARDFTTFSNSERIAEINGSIACQSQFDGAVNAALSDVFPWLASIAAKYEHYRFKKLEFEYVPTRGTDVSGEVGIMFDPDTYDPPPGSMAELLQSKQSVSGAPWRTFKLHTDKVAERKFTRSGHPTAVSIDLKTYDIGRIHVLTCGMADASQVGYLMVHYSVDLYQPQPAETADPSGPVPHVAMYSLASNFDLQGVDDTSWHDIDMSLFGAVFDGIGVTHGSTLVLPPGVFKVVATAGHRVETTATTGFSWAASRLNIGAYGHMLTYFNTDNANTSDTMYASGCQTAYITSLATSPAEINLQYYHDASVSGSDAANNLLGGTFSANGGPWTFLIIERVALV